MKCRHCGSTVTLDLIDLGSAPPSNAYLTQLTMRRPEKWFPLKVLVCESCWLVQAEAYSRAAELFNDEYAYFSSCSDAWLSHACAFVDKMVGMVPLTESSFVVEVASNDGYLLQYVAQKGIDCLGVEPTASTAAAARQKGIRCIEEFFGTALAERISRDKGKAKLIVANNVLAHVPDINDFVSGFRILLADDGVATFEFPHLMNLIHGCQFDTIYHEHFSYLSFTTVNRIFATNGLEAFDVDEIDTHGGSLRVFAQLSGTGSREKKVSVQDLLDRERSIGMFRAEFYEGFDRRAEKIKIDFMDFLIKQRRLGDTVAGYGAAAKGNTLLNYSGVKADLISFVVDKSTAKQGKFLPGSRIPIVSEEYLKLAKPRYVIVFPWNISAEIVAQLSYIRSWGGEFVTAVPSLKIF